MAADANSIVWVPEGQSRGSKDSETMNIPLAYIGDGKWKVLYGFGVELSDGSIVKIPCGYRTDLSSVPRVLWSIFSPIDNSMYAAIVHDYLYETEYKSDVLGRKHARKYADKQLLYLSSKHNPKKPLDNKLRYLAVRIFGKKRYAKDEQQKGKDNHSE